MKKGVGLSASVRRAMLKRALAVRRKQREELFPKPRLVWVNDQAEEAQIADRASEPRLGRMAPFR